MNHPNQIQTLFEVETLESALNKVGLLYKDSIACSYAEQAVSYTNLVEQVMEFKKWLNNTLGKKTVLVKTGNDISNLFLMIGSIISDSVPLFCDPVWKESELLKALQINHCNFIICEEPIQKLSLSTELIGELGIYKLYEIKSSVLHDNKQLRLDTAFCRFTSGTTGFSRCLQFTEKAFMNAGYNWWHTAQHQSKDVVYCLAALNNGLAFNTSLLATFFTGAHLVIHKGSLVPSILKKTLEKHSPTIIVAFPFIYELLTITKKIGKEQLNVRLAVSSAAPLSTGTYELFNHKFGINICNYYGLAEVGPCTFNGGDPHSVGKQLKNVRIRIDETERVLIKTNSMASSFLDNLDEDFSKSLTEDGFYISKDIGVINSDGVLALKGRVGRMINIQGRKIDPVEIEQLLESNFEVKKAIVMPHEQQGRTILVAYVSGKNSNKEYLMKLCADNLSPYKIPQQLIIVESFPRSSTGKLSLGTLQTELT